MFRRCRVVLGKGNAQDADPSSIGSCVLQWITDEVWRLRLEERMPSRWRGVQGDEVTKCSLLGYVGLSGPGSGSRRGDDSDARRYRAEANQIVQQIVAEVCEVPGPFARDEGVHGDVLGVGLRGGVS